MDNEINMDEEITLDEFDELLNDSSNPNSDEELSKARSKVDGKKTTETTEKKTEPKKETNPEELTIGLEEPEKDTKEEKQKQTEKTPELNLDNPDEKSQEEEKKTSEPEKQDNKTGDKTEELDLGQPLEKTTEDKNPTPSKPKTPTVLPSKSIPLTNVMDEEEEELIVSPEGDVNKEVFAIAGEKGVGKTYTAFSFPGKKGCIALDNKAIVVKKNDYANDEDIIVYSGTKYYHTRDKDMITKSAATTFVYLNKIIDVLESEVHPDWIIIDNFERLSRIAEFAARFYNKLPPFAGTGQVGWKLWDERNFYLNSIFNRVLDIAKKGVIYTLYMKTEDTLVVDGAVVEKVQHPKWIDSVLYETDTALKVWKEAGKRKYMVEVLTSKDDKNIPNGLKFETTDMPLFEALKQAKENK